ncbi:right-handed parallel beta-helix repeat-containing protein [Celerinatantimonas sp. MCCC 1A17872]|uniref:right-handed parallel beta-helix repeat-containing protein n=1 Tax=Celerinatantimonas sp. MCCC 1A17872 TaxID=3177514 RepID=UPI0038C71060
MLTSCASALLMMSASSAYAASHVWTPITFGQSTDLNFGSTILPNKIGTNEVTHNGKQVVKAGPLLDHFTIESRGGKLANSHEGGTFYYTVLPTDENFSLSADVTLEELGPETGATPNRQEGAGLIVRDIIGPARANPQPLGHEEFPSASNMVMNLLRSHSRTNDGMANANGSYREGIKAPWGSPHNLLKRHDYVKGLPHDASHTYHMMLVRNDKNFEVSITQDGKTQSYQIKAPANLVSVQDPKHQYVGFFAARNAKVKFANVDLKTSTAHTVNAPQYQSPQTPTLVEVASAKLTGLHDYAVQALANYAGVYQVYQDGKALGEPVELQAGELLSVPAQVKDSSKFKLTFTKQGEKEVSSTKTWQVKYSSQLANPRDVYVAVNGSPKNDGSQSHPVDLQTAVSLVAPGGEIHLASGKYKGLYLDPSLSGGATQPKVLIGEGNVSFTDQVRVKANNWQLFNFEVVGERLIINGSHNWIDHVTVHEAPDTGIQVTSSRGIGRALWASYNLITNSESYNNMDKSQINADGFAVKMRVGDGNTLVNCISHHNVDDGFDLFNKVEDGPNGAVKIINSIAFNNGQTFHMKNMKGGHRGNGFKLGGEGLPVGHSLINSLSFNNHMDGITDNFNPGSLTILNDLSIDNQRFNYIIRKNPYGTMLRPAYLSENVSIHLNKGKHNDDAVHGDVVSSNEFYKNGQNKTHYSQKQLKQLYSIISKPVTTESEARKEVKAIRNLLY